MSDENKLHQVIANLPSYHFERLKGIVKARGTSITMMLSLLIDAEFDKDKPFHYDLTLAGEGAAEYVYADQAGKILNFMILYGRALKLSSVMMLRHKIGVRERIELLGGFNELVVKNMIEGRKSKFGNEIEYKITGEFKSNRDRGRKNRTKAERYALLQKLKKEFKDEE